MATFKPGDRVTITPLKDREGRIVSSPMTPAVVEGGLTAYRVRYEDPNQAGSNDQIYFDDELEPVEVTQQPTKK